MEKGGGNRERMRKCRESISFHFLIFSPFPPHFLILSPFPRSPAATIRAALTWGREGVWIPPKSDDVIYEQPLITINSCFKTIY